MCKRLEELADFYGACIVDYDFPRSIRGVYHDGVIAINKDVKSENERRCIIACELGRHIMRNNNSIVLPDELKDLSALHWAVVNLMPLSAIADAYRQGANTLEEYADHLGVTSQFFRGGIDFYSRTFGTRILQDGIIIRFDSHRVQCAEKEG